MRRAENADQHCLKPTSPLTMLHIALHLNMQPLLTTAVFWLWCGPLGFTSPLHLPHASEAPAV